MNTILINKIENHLKKGDSQKTVSPTYGFACFRTGFPDQGSGVLA